MSYQRVHAYAWVGPGGRMRISDEQKPGYYKKVKRIYKITTKDGMQDYCTREDRLDKWWWPIDGSAPIRRKAVVECEDITRIMYEEGILRDWGMVQFL